MFEVKHSIVIIREGLRNVSISTGFRIFEIIFTDKVVEVANASLIIPQYINKSHSINEVIPKGAAPVPFRTVRPAEINETRAPNRLNTTTVFLR